MTSCWISQLFFSSFLSFASVGEYFNLLLIDHLGELFFYVSYIFILCADDGGSVTWLKCQNTNTALHMPLQSSHIKTRLQKTFKKRYCGCCADIICRKNKMLKNATVCNHDINKTQSKLIEMCKRQNQNSKLIKQKNHRFVTLNSTQLLLDSF